MVRRPSLRPALPRRHALPSAVPRRRSADVRAGLLPKWGGRNTFQPGIGQVYYTPQAAGGRGAAPHADDALVAYVQLMGQDSFGTNTLKKILVSNGQ